MTERDILARNSLRRGQSEYTDRGLSSRQDWDEIQALRNPEPAPETPAQEPDDTTAVVATKVHTNPQAPLGPGDAVEATPDPDKPTRPNVGGVPLTIPQVQSSKAMDAHKTERKAMQSSKPKR